MKQLRIDGIHKLEDRIASVPIRFSEMDPMGSKSVLIKIGRLTENSDEYCFRVSYTIPISTGAMYTTHNGYLIIKRNIENGAYDNIGTVLDGVVVRFEYPISDKIGGVVMNNREAIWFYSPLKNMSMHNFVARLQSGGWSGWRVG